MGKSTGIHPVSDAASLFTNDLCAVRSNRERMPIYFVEFCIQWTRNYDGVSIRWTGLSNRTHNKMVILWNDYRRKQVAWFVHIWDHWIKFCLFLQPSMLVGRLFAFVFFAHFPRSRWHGNLFYWFLWDALRHHWHFGCVRVCACNENVCGLVKFIPIIVLFFPDQFTLIQDQF